MVDAVCKWAHERISQKDFILLDTETTSLDGEVIDLAILDAEGNTIFDSLIRPVGRIEESAGRVHHITQEMVKDAPTFAQAWPEISLYFADPAQHIITYNAMFDHVMIVNSMVLHHLNHGELKGEWNCLMDRYMRHIGRLRWQRLDDALRQQGLEVHNTHRALADAQAAYSLLAHLASKHEKLHAGEGEKTQPLATHLSDNPLVEGQQFKRIIGAHQSAREETPRAETPLEAMLDYPGVKTEPLAL